MTPPLDKVLKISFVWEQRNVNLWLVKIKTTSYHVIADATEYNLYIFRIGFSPLRWWNFCLLGLLEYMLNFCFYITQSNLPNFVHGMNFYQFICLHLGYISFIFIVWTVYTSRMEFEDLMTDSADKIGDVFMRLNIPIPFWEAHPFYTTNWETSHKLYTYQNILMAHLNISKSET